MYIRESRQWLTSSSSLPDNLLLHLVLTYHSSHISFNHTWSSHSHRTYPNVTTERTHQTWYISLLVVLDLGTLTNWIQQWRPSGPTMEQGLHKTSGQSTCNLAVSNTSSLSELSDWTATCGVWLYCRNYQTGPPSVHMSALLYFDPAPSTASISCLFLLLCSIYMIYTYLMQCWSISDIYVCPFTLWSRSFYRVYLLFISPVMFYILDIHILCNTGEYLTFIPLIAHC
jgi:hypothetical protein